MGVWARLGMAIGTVMFLLLQAAPAAAELADNLSAYTGRNAQGYFGPLVDAFAADLNAGTFHSAYIPERGLQLSLEVRAMSVYFSDADRTFIATTEGLFRPETTVEAPTVVGRPEVVWVEGVGGTAYAFPSGFGLDSFQFAVPQLRLGSFYGTEMVFRFAFLDQGNDLLVGDLSLNLWGIGLRHSVSQYLNNDFPVDVAASVFWQRFAMEEKERGDDLVTAKTLSIGLQVSKRFAMFEPYAGLAYDRFSLDASYEDEGDPTDRVQLGFDRNDIVQLTLGLSFDLAFLNVHGEYNILEDHLQTRQDALSVGVALQYHR
ncbi:MAG: autotransporter outer membrane beta-barrel domain-containing protein [Candidatus Krumholzibacteria bacterium]|nr:autotransporter outer membrane beta-barrel domain-containing protein [Candidatus Krumholzibacteria bacterium]